MFKAKHIRALFKKAGIGQDGKEVHIQLETEDEATKVFEYVCELGSKPETSTWWRRAWSVMVKQ